MRGTGSPKGDPPAGIRQLFAQVRICCANARFGSVPPAQSQARWSFQPSHAATTLPNATRNNVSATDTPTRTNPVSIKVATTIAPELTMLLAATVRAVSDLGTVVVRKA